AKARTAIEQFEGLGRNVRLPDPGLAAIAAVAAQGRVEPWPGPPLRRTLPRRCEIDLAAEPDAAAVAAAVAMSDHARCSGCGSSPRRAAGPEIDRRCGRGDTVTARPPACPRRMPQGRGGTRHRGSACAGRCRRAGWIA